MPKEVLFLNRKSKTEFYTNERNRYENVTSACFFKKTGFFGGILRKTLKIPGSSLFFDDWKYNISNYDLFIITASKFGLEIAKYIRKRTNKRIIHWYWNPVCTDVAPNTIRGYDCEFYSFDRDDCLRYDMNYIPPYYFSTIQLPQNEIIYDIYFVGADKGRLDQLLELKKLFEDQELTVEYHITKKKSKSKKVQEYVYQPEIPYTQVLEGISKCRAILDYVQVGQTGLTQRPLEALFHKKKLITNDINVNSFDFYNKDNIFILGEDDINNLKKFINSPFIDVDKNIVEKYDFGNWLKQIQ